MSATYSSGCETGSGIGKAVPELVQEVLTAQSASFAAGYISNVCRQSLQAAAKV